MSHRALKPVQLFLPHDASTERGYEIACRPSVCLSVRLSVCDDQVP